LLIPKESKVGKRLSDLTTRRVIVIVLAMMFSVPVFTISTYTDDNDSFSFGLSLIQSFENSSKGQMSNFNNYIKEHKDLRTPLIQVIAMNMTWNSSTDPSSIRVTDKQVVTLDEGNYVSIIDMRANSKLSSGLSICRTFFVCFVLAGSALFFSKDAHDLVIAPIEAMV
jgi:hypothetical protein